MILEGVSRPRFSIYASRITDYLMSRPPLPRPHTWFITLIILLALGGLLRLFDITDPPLDFQPSRQLRNSIVARDIYYSILPSATTEQRELASSFARSVGKYEPPVIESIGVHLLITGETLLCAWVTTSAVGGSLFDLMPRNLRLAPDRAGVLSRPAVFGAGKFFSARSINDLSVRVGIYFLIAG